MKNDFKAVGFLLENLFDSWDVEHQCGMLEDFCRYRLGSNDTDVILSDEACAFADFTDLIEQYRPNASNPNGCIFVVPTLDHVKCDTHILQAIIQNSIAVVPIDQFGDGNARIEANLLIQEALKAHRSLYSSFEKKMGLRREKTAKEIEARRKRADKEARHRELIKPCLLHEIQKGNLSFYSIAEVFNNANEECETDQPFPTFSDKSKWHSETIKRIIFKDDELKDEYQKRKR
ncbi:hypothetical protein GCM10011332_29510 [Terasakiella brassicae]|uniref:Uncharacterized protein n=1 Tax=Terasakiella brassicae TaxID=1634917 RepID=A0A917C5Y3_9PROT|nr:hypothetical protein [Terasakiella brassicae]GGF73562.1 hypothetical protein GCM10011332_29510 [Terasakiella brassicae]